MKRDKELNELIDSLIGSSYEDTYVEEDDSIDEVFEGILMDCLWDYLDQGMIDIDSLETFKNEGVLTNNRGLVIKVPNLSFYDKRYEGPFEFFITITHK